MENTNKYIPVIGLEIHLQVKTKSKMFCRCSSEYFNEPPNTHVCPVCFGLPGALPMPNKTAFEKAIKLSRALDCTINKNTKFDRKNYFYPDLPKGYQISQFDKPIGEDGFVEIEVNDDSRRIRLQRLHLEEDTAKSMHSDDGETLIDYNKSGVPLIEMVTRPDFQSTEEVISFAKRLRQIVRYTDISDAEMQKGQMRFELNISLRKPEETGLPNYKVEVKNIGSISVLEKVIEFEIERQAKLLDEGKEIKPQTRGIRDLTGKTVFQRSKETSDDYRYFPEPDIPPINIEDSTIKSLEDSIGELPLDRKKRYINLGLESEQADVFVEDVERGNYFDQTIKVAGDKYIKDISNWINSDIAGILVKKNINFSDSPITPKDIIYIVKTIEDKKITSAVAKKVLEKRLTTDKSVEEIVKDDNLLQINDSSEVDGFIEQVISENQKVVEDIQKNPNAVKFLVGQVMKISKGRVNPNTAQKLLEEKLGL